MGSVKPTWSLKHERLIILALCVIGGIRVFLFNAAFPLFNNVDEPNHFDLVYRYCHGDVPRHGIEKYNRKALELILWYRTTEYLTDKPAPAPPWIIRNMRQSPEFAQYLAKRWEELNNDQAGSFPAYYAIAGLWYKAGEALGLGEGELIYWLRFLNIPIFVLLILVSYATAKSLYHDGDNAHIALPLLITFFPQDTFYSISNDVLSPLLFGVAFFMLVRIYNQKKFYTYHFIAGLFVAATFLTKISNITIFAMVGIVILLKLKKSYSEKLVRQHLPYLLVFLAAAMIPTSLWLMRNHFVIGDALASSEKTVNSGWTVKPLIERFNHPIFTAKGVTYFLTELTKTFWRGEFSWHLKTMAYHGMDIFYEVSSAIFLLACGAALLAKKKADNEKRFEISMSFFVLIVSVLFMVMLSITFDFHNWFSPSREKPYFTAGRLIGGILIPFLIIYLDGLKRLLTLVKCHRCLILIVAFIVIAITWSEISMSAIVFQSQYNWFHLR